MTKDGTAFAVDSSPLITSLFALIPVPVAVVDANGGIVLSNSAFNDLFPNTENIRALPQHELESSGRGTYDFQTVPLNDDGLNIAYAREITNEVVLRRQVVHLEKMAAMGCMVSGIAHELNNPLAGILGSSQLVSSSELDPRARRMLEAILTHAERADKVVQNCLSLAAKTELARILFDLNEIIRNVILGCEYQEQVQDICITSELSADLPRAWGDPHQLEQVLLNLIRNAEDAINDGQHRPGSIHVKTTAQGSRILVTITDNGSGIRPRDMDHIFDRFFTTKDHRRGTGLGLTICSEIVNDHGGELYAWSTYGKGSTFTLELPIQDSGPATGDRRGYQS